MTGSPSISPDRTTSVRPLAPALAAALAVTLIAAPAAHAQSPMGVRSNAPPERPAEVKAERSLPADTAITSTGEVTIRGQRVPYRVTTGTQPVYGQDGMADAALHYTFYERTDVRDRSRRPLFIS